MSEWDGTAWSGSIVPARKAITGPGVIAYYQDRPLSILTETPQQRAAAFLRAYKCGWFHKAGRKISTDIASLDWSISDGDAESEDPAETVIAKPDLDIPFDALGPIEQFIRLLERPNPYQTGKQLVQKTQIRKDFGGVGFWYLENGEGKGLPTAIYGISPSRLTPARDKQGIVIGWVLDKDNPSGGVPFDIDEIIPFSMSSADDDDVFGVGVVESVYSELPLTDLMARHTTDLLTTGGRLAGMLSPKDRSLTEDEFQDALRAWRNVASDPNAARRLLLFPEPMEYSAGASTPAEIGIPELAALNRDNILTAFPISPYQLGVPTPGGLNSGEVRREDRRDYWEGTIHPRVDDLEDTIQVQLLSRYERFMGRTFDFEIEEPNLDDAASLIQKIAAYKALIESGFDDSEARSAAGLDHIKYIAVPASIDPVAQAEAAAATAQAQADALTTNVSEGSRTGISERIQQPVAKSRRERREQSEAEAADVAKTELGRFFDAQKERVVTRIRESLPRTKALRKADPSEWWNGVEEDKALRTALQHLYVKVGYDSLQLLADELSRTVIAPNTRRVLADLLSYGGARITDINERTRDAVKAQLAEGVRRGYSINQLIEGVEAEKYAGISKATLDNGQLAFDPYRAEVIARTETALSFNRAALAGYKEFAIREVQAIDGDQDEVCAARDGHTFSVEEAYGIEDHPNGTLDWIPVIPFEKAKDEPFTMRELAAALKTASPVVNVTVESAKAPEVTVPVTVPVSVEPTPITVESPVVNVTNDLPALSVINEVLTPSVTVQNDVPVPSVSVTNEVVTPVVNVTTPEVTVVNEVATPTVTVEAPNVTVTNEVVSPEVTVKAPTVHVHVPEAKPLTRTIKRDKKGQIVSISDGE